MAVKIHPDRKAVVLSYDAGDYVGGIEVVTVNADDESDVSSSKLESNDGMAVVSFPASYAGKFHASVNNDMGELIDEGDVEVK